MTAAAALTLLATALAGCGGGGSTTIEQTVTEPPAPTTTTAAPISFPSLVTRVRTGIVRIQATDCRNGDLGTGFLIAPDLVATVDHVVAGATTIELTTSGSHRKIAATVVGADPAQDVALLRTAQPITGHVFKLAGRAPRLGESVAAFGFPFALPLTVTRGSVSGLGRTIPIDGEQRTDMVQTDAAINPGNSGGPLISTDTDEVVGLVDLGSSQANGIGFAVSAHIAEPLIRRWQALPQPPAPPACNVATAPAPTTQLSESYTGPYFAMRYPLSWSMQTRNASEGAYDETVVASAADPDLQVRVDVWPGLSHQPDPLRSAEQLEAGLIGRPGYRRVIWRRYTFNDQTAFAWGYRYSDDGTAMDVIDVLVDGPNGNDFSIVTSSPARFWATEFFMLAAIRDSIAFE